MQLSRNVYLSKWQRYHDLSVAERDAAEQNLKEVEEKWGIDGDDGVGRGVAEVTGVVPNNELDTKSTKELHADEVFLVGWGSSKIDVKTLENHLEEAEDRWNAAANLMHGKTWQPP